MAGQLGSEPRQLTMLIRHAFGSTGCPRPPESRAGCPCPADRGTPCGSTCAEVSSRRSCRTSRPSGCPRRRRRCRSPPGTGGAVTAYTDVGEDVVDVVGEAGRLGEVELVAVPVRVGAAGVPRLGAAGDVQRAARGALEGLGALGGGQVELVERGAGGDVAVGAAAGGRPGDSGGAEPGGGLGVRELGGGVGLGAPPPRTPTPGAKRMPRTRANAVRTGRSLIWDSMGGLLLLMTSKGMQILPEFYARPPEGAATAGSN